MSHYNFSMQTSLKRKTTADFFHTQTNFRLHHHYRNFAHISSTKERQRDREEELLSEMGFTVVSQSLWLFGEMEFCNSWYYQFTNRTWYTKQHQHGNDEWLWKSHLTPFQICTGTAYWVSVVQIFVYFMYSSPSNILQVPLWFKWQPLMRMILLTATVLEWFTAYYKDSLTSLWSPKQVNLHKPFAVTLRKRGKCALKFSRNLLIMTSRLIEYIQVLLTF